MELPHPPHYARRLCRPLYGLKQAPCAWLNASAMPFSALTILRVFMIHNVLLLHQMWSSASSPCWLYAYHRRWSRGHLVSKELSQFTVWSEGSWSSVLLHAILRNAIKCLPTFLRPAFFHKWCIFETFFREQGWPIQKLLALHLTQFSLWFWWHSPFWSHLFVTHNIAVILGWVPVLFNSLSHCLESFNHLPSFCFEIRV